MSVIFIVLTQAWWSIPYVIAALPAISSTALGGAHAGAAACATFSP